MADRATQHAFPCRVVILLRKVDKVAVLQRVPHSEKFDGGSATSKAFVVRQTAFAQPACSGFCMTFFGKVVASEIVKQDPQAKARRCSETVVLTWLSVSSVPSGTSRCVCQSADRILLISAP